MESGAKQGEENIGFKRPEHEIEEMVKRFPETASRGDCLDFVHVLDLVFLFLCKQAEFFNLHCMMRIRSGAIGFGIWKKKSAPSRFLFSLQEQTKIRSNLFLNWGWLFGERFVLLKTGQTYSYKAKSRKNFRLF